MAFRERLKRCQPGGEPAFPPGERLTDVNQEGEHSSFKKNLSALPLAWIAAVRFPARPRFANGAAWRRIRSISFCNARRTTSGKVAYSPFANSRSRATMATGMLIRPRGSFSLTRRWYPFWPKWTRVEKILLPTRCQKSGCFGGFWWAAMDHGSFNEKPEDPLFMRFSGLNKGSAAQCSILAPAPSRCADSVRKSRWKTVRCGPEELSTRVFLPA